MSNTFRVNPADLDELERLHMDVFRPGLERERWRAQAHLIRFIEEHPTLLPFLISAGRLQFAERRQNPITPPFGNVEEQVR